MNPGGQPSNRQRDRIGKTQSLFVRQHSRLDPVRLAVNVTGSIIADRGITGYISQYCALGLLSRKRSHTYNEWGGDAAAQCCRDMVFSRYRLYRDISRYCIAIFFYYIHRAIIYQ